MSWNRNPFFIVISIYSILNAISKIEKNDLFIWACKKFQGSFKGCWAGRGWKVERQEDKITSRQDASYHHGNKSPFLELRIKIVLETKTKNRVLFVAKEVSRFTKDIWRKKILKIYCNKIWNNIFFFFLFTYKFK